MLDPRLYRTGFLAVALAVVMFAFSLTNQQGPIAATLAPDAFNGGNVSTLLTRFVNDYPDRSPGSSGDDALAAEVASRLRAIGGYSVSTGVSQARTATGTRTLETVTATRAGQTSGTILVLAHRDALGSPAAADLSGTATLLELARVLAGESQQHTIVLASTSGSDGAAGAAQLARSLPGPIDAVIALGDLASAHVRQPVVVPWSSGQQVAPTLLRNTVAAVLGAQAALKPGGASLGGQVARLAFPLTLSEQGPFGALGIPAVTLSVSGDGKPDANAAADGGQLTAMGKTVLQTVTTLDGGRQIPAATPYLLYDGKVIPAWAVKLLVLAFIVPVLITTIDGLARARRRGHAITRSTLWVLASAVPFVLALLVALAARVLGVISAAPPGPVGAGVIPLHGSGVTLLVLLGLIIAGSFVALRMFLPLLGTPRDRRTREEDPQGSLGQGAALLLVMCAVTLAVWAINPFAALLIIPALHLWMWIADPEVRLRPLVSLLLLVVGLLPPVAVVLYYAGSLSLSPVDVLWNGLLLIVGGQVSLLTALAWCVLLGCVAGVVALGIRGLRQPRPEERPVTVRGPVSYAGPGSLGGTKSALRR